MGELEKCSQSSSSSRKKKKKSPKLQRQDKRDYLAAVDYYAAILFFILVYISHVDDDDDDDNVQDEDYESVNTHGMCSRSFMIMRARTAAVAAFTPTLLPPAPALISGCRMHGGGRRGKLTSIPLW